MPHKKMNKSAEKALLSTLANKARLNIVFALVDGEKNVTEIMETLGIGQTLVSHNLKRLAGSGFVRVRRQGNFRYYSLNKDFAAPFLQAIDPTLRRGRGDSIRLRAIIMQSPVVIIAFDREGVITFVSGDTMPRFGLAARRMLGATLAGLSRRDLKDLDRPALEGKTVGRTIRTGKKTFDILTVPYRDASGRVIGGISVTHEVTGRAGAEAALRSIAREWRSLAEGSPDLIADVDRDGVFLVVNREIKGFTREQVIGTVLYDYLPESIRKEVGAKLRNVFRTGREEHFRSTGVGRTVAEGMFECRIVAHKNKGRAISVTFTARGAGPGKR
ncbi:MAG TPA: metalloregulator ArsR/SmtB family transcription factor [Candidatus Eisenbacteria bacterium]|nr:metalloregulator ArsR/SmtB family transcription factor [Candidatus Eisenbacteria bacterium]